jgi:photosystem II stability/assembly factor-like uncharacterized protein
MLSHGMTPLLVCTRDGLVRLDGAGSSWKRVALLEGKPARCVAAGRGRLLVGTRDGALLSRDDGASWHRAELPETDVYSVAIGAGDGMLFAGTEPSRLFRSADGDRWDELDALQSIPSRGSWSYPPRPWTSHVRWIAPDPHRSERLLVGIELGGLMYSDDGGESFTDHRPGAERDVHALAWHPRVEGRSYEAAGGGATWSRDGGVTWEAAESGREHRYCWALAVDPDDPERWYVSAAHGPRQAHGAGAARAGLYRWEGAGPWERIEQGLPRPLDSMPYALVATSAGLFAGLANGRIFSSADRGDSWEELPVRAESVVAMTLGDPS